MSRHNKERRLAKLKESGTEPIPSGGLSVPRALWRYVRQIPSGRGCDGCTACCTATGVAALGKPPHSRCEHEVEGGCGIYGKHPFECKEYACLWRMGWGSERDRPDRSGIILHLDRHPMRPDDLLYSSVELIELKTGAINARFPEGGHDLNRLLAGDETLIVTIHLYGTPRARPPYALPPYDINSLPAGKEDYVGNDRVLVQLGVMNRSGDLHVGHKIVPAAERQHYIEKLLGNGEPGGAEGASPREA